MKDSTLTIAIVSHAQSHLVRKLLTSLESYPPEIKTQLVVIENVSDDPEIQTKDDKLPLIYHRNDTIHSLSANINKAFRMGGDDFDYFCVLNPDIVFEEEVFTPLISVLEQHQVDVIAPLIVDSRGVIQDSFRPTPNPLELILRRLGLKQTIYEYDTLPEVSFPDWIGAMFMLMPSAVFREIGGFDPKFKLYLEDVDFCLRAWQKGFRVGVLKDARVIHDAQRESKRSIKFFLTHISSALKFFTSDVYRMWRKKQGKG